MQLSVPVVTEWIQCSLLELPRGNSRENSGIIQYNKPQERIQWKTNNESWLETGESNKTVNKRVSRMQYANYSYTLRIQKSQI